MDQFDSDVLIVGLGPVGAALANLLGRYGVRTVVIDKATEIFKAPRAIALDNEALRVLQMCGLAEGDIDTVAIPEVRMHSPYFGQYSRAITAGSVDGHPKLVTFYQPQLEQVLRERLARYPHVSVRLGVSWRGLTSTANGAVAELCDEAGQVVSHRTRYVVGADGANSMVRRWMGLDFKGKTYAEDWLVVDALHAPQAIDHVEFICDPCRPTPHMVAPGQRQRWEFKLQPGETREEMERPETVRKLLAAWSGGRDLEIERVAVYRFHARVADVFRKGRVMLVGDAAHITPPFVGQGLVAGLRDVANLAWKLAWVLNGQARPTLLDSFDEERRPHARSMIQLAQWMGRLVMPSNRLAAWLTHGAMKLMSQVPRVRDLFEQLDIKPPNRFDRGCFMQRARHSRLFRGGQLPQAWVRRLGVPDDIRLSDDALGTGFVVVGFGVDPEAALPASLIRHWGRLGGTFVSIMPRGTAACARAGAVWEDFGGALIPVQAPTGWVAIVRPDKTVMHDGPASQLATMLADASALFAPQTGQAQDDDAHALSCAL